MLHDVLGSPGEPLDPSSRAYLEPRFRAVLGDVPANGQTSAAAPHPSRLGQAGDAHEQEADRIADQVVRAPATDGAPRFDFSHVRLHTGRDAAESARAIRAAAFTAGNHVVWGSGPDLPGSTRGRLILAHELAHVVEHGRAGGDATAVRRFAAFTPDEQLAGDSLGWKHPGGKPLRISDDGQMAVEDNGWGQGTNHRAWSTPSKVGQSNGILSGQHSRAHLQLKGGGEEISGSAPASRSSSTLQEMEPVKEGGGPINLASDCGAACRQIMGSGGKDEAVINKEPNTKAGEAIGAGVGLLAGVGIGFAVGGGLGAAIGGVAGLAGGFFAGREIAKATGSKETLTPREYHGGGWYPGAPTTAPEEWSEEVYKKEFGQNLTRQEALNRYAALSDDEKDKFDRKYGINKYAVPKTGQGITIGSEVDMPGYADPSGDAWNFHYAANVMTSGQDYVTLESAAGWGPDDWIFFMYGPASKSQSFYEEQRATGTHGNKNTALVVQPAK